MSKMNWHLLGTLAITLSFIGCASTTSVESFKQEKYRNTLSVSAYEQVVPRLKKLEPGDSVDGSTFGGSYYKVGKDDRVAEIDGWVAPMSGNYFGGVFGFGDVVGRTKDTINGAHVFGYLIANTTLVPKYVVQTQATIISPEEYNRLGKNNAGNRGWVDIGIPPLSMTHYRDVVVKEVRQLEFQYVKDFEIDEKVGSIGDVIRIHTTRNRFSSAENKLKSLARGTDIWDTIRILNGLFITLDSGLEYLLLADGYLGGAWRKMTSEGVFLVWSFGYIEGPVETRKLSLIFKNNKVHELVPHASREELIHFFK